MALYLEGSTNLNTVPVGDMALGYDVAKKYSSPENQKNLTVIPSHTEGRGRGGGRQTLPASSSAKEMMYLW